MIVSHSPKVAEGTADMVREMVGTEVRVAHCGGNPDGGLGTDVAAIQAAIERVFSPAGVAVLVDLGGAETNSEMAIELLPEPAPRARRDLQRPDRRRRGHGGDRSLGWRVAGRGPGHRRRTLTLMERAVTLAAEAPELPPQATGEAIVRDPTGLHARPAVKLTKLAKSFAGDGPGAQRRQRRLGERQVADRHDEAQGAARRNPGVPPTVRMPPKLSPPWSRWSSATSMNEAAGRPC